MLLYYLPRIEFGGEFPHGDTSLLMSKPRGNLDANPCATRRISPYLGICVWYSEPAGKLISPSSSATFRGFHLEITVCTGIERLPIRCLAIEAASCIDKT